MLYLNVKRVIITELFVNQILAFYFQRPSYYCNYRQLICNFNSLVIIELRAKFISECMFFDAKKEFKSF